MEEEARKEEEARAAAAPVITLDEILFVCIWLIIVRNDGKIELQQEEEKKARTEKKIDEGLGYTELVEEGRDSDVQQDDYVEEYMDQENELTALEQLQKKIQRKILEVRKSFIF